MKMVRNFFYALLFLSGTANATVINLTVNGTVTTAVNYGGLAPGDAITADLVLDITGYTGTGVETFVFTGPNTLNITAGSLSFDESMDAALNASVSFFDGVMGDLSLNAQYTVNGAPEDFTSYSLSVLSNRSVTTGRGGNQTTTNYQLGATWNPVTLSAVPVPAAVWLFGSGLVGLAGIARRKKAD